MKPKQKIERLIDSKLEEQEEKNEVENELIFFKFIIVLLTRTNHFHSCNDRVHKVKAFENQ